jgi:hypothetical protein
MVCEPELRNFAFAWFQNAPPTGGWMEAQYEPHVTCANGDSTEPFTAKELTVEE